MLSSTLAQSLTFGVLGTAFFIAPPVLAASMYSISDLGTLPGYQEITASDINNLGQVVGTARSGTFNPQARVYLGKWYDDRPWNTSRLHS